MLRSCVSLFAIKHLFTACLRRLLLYLAFSSISACSIVACATTSGASASGTSAPNASTTSKAQISELAGSTLGTSAQPERVSSTPPSSAPPTTPSPPATAPGTAPQTPSQPALLMGQLTWEDWKKHARWSRYDAPHYNPSSVFTQRIEEDMSTGEISFLLFAGSWCEDSQNELPLLFKLLEVSNVPSSKVQIHGVDENKHDLAGLAQKYGIYKVPTLIAFKNGRELGRIIERPRTSWELDVIVIIER